MRISVRSPFRANSKARQLYKQKLHRDVLLSSAEKKENERKLKRTREYKENLFTPHIILAFVLLLLTQITMAGLITWVVHSLNSFIRDQLLEPLIEMFDSLLGTHPEINGTIRVKGYISNDIFLS